MSDRATNTPAAAMDPAEAARAEIEKMRPRVQADGGDIEFVGYQEGVATIRMLGACATCPSAILTVKAGLEAHLRERVPEVRKVVAL